MQYSEKLMDHFRNPRNVGEIPDADGIGEVGNPVCGDMMCFYIKVKDDKIIDIKFKTFGCGAAIAVSSIVSEMAKGKTLEEALKITRQSIAEELGGLPVHKMHCSNLGEEALRKAIEDYRHKKAHRKVTPKEDKSHLKASSLKEISPCIKVKCPYCNRDLDLEAPPFICQFCQKNIAISVDAD